MDLFFLISVILFVGLFASFLKDQTGIPSSVVLILFGMALSLVLPAEGLRELAPFVGSLALLLILFNAGLRIEVQKLLDRLTEASMFTILNFLVSALVLGLIGKLLLGLPDSIALLLGFVLGGTSSAAVISLLSVAPMEAKWREILLLESTLTDVLVILSATLLLTTGSLGMAFLEALVSSLAVSVVLGAVASSLWLSLLKLVRREISYAATLGTLFLLYWISSLLGGNGLLSAFIFGLLLGNFGKMTGWRTPLRVFRLQEEVSFFATTFFFVYSGLLAGIPGPEFAGGLLLGLGIYAARVISLLLFQAADPVLLLIAPRGLAAAVLATMVSRSLATLVTSVILLTNLVPLALPLLRRPATTSIPEDEP